MLKARPEMNVFIDGLNCIYSYDIYTNGFVLFMHRHWAGLGRSED